MTQTPQKIPRNIVNGWINLDKPLEMTSTQAVGKIKRILNVKKVGHAGTLDPMATGILPIAIGEATKTVQFIQDREKGYSFTIMWGEAKDTDDGEGETIASSDVRPSEDAIIAALPAFIGEIDQIPPKFSAIKIKGARAYDLAREGVEFEMKSRKVNVYDLTLVHCDDKTATLSMRCGKGTYVRSLARDLALELGTYGYVSMLRRTFVGGFHENDAISFDKLAEIVDNSGAQEATLGLETALDDIPALPLSDQEASRLRNGQKIIFSARPDMERLNAHGINPLTAKDMIVLAVNDNGKPLGITRMNGVSMKPERLFNL
ncbi:MAG: tRNA pseudouridine(55) synthase TruB [Alphaproteobacteria bacterium]|nr:MAG: tRNA pseudouridine(55) synthase TruB [Alphaproteobacteria bacterium]